jgi:hypothetical protein
VSVTCEYDVGIVREMRKLTKKKPFVISKQLSEKERTNGAGRILSV